MEEVSPGKVQNLFPRAARLYLMRLDDFWASLFVASSPPAPGLTASSCSCGREFATRFFRLRLAVTPCVSLRLPSSVPIGSFHPIRFCPCWAHDTRRQPRLFGVKVTRLSPRVPLFRAGRGSDRASDAHVLATSCAPRGRHFEWISERNSSRVSLFVRKAPSIALVTVPECCFSTPRIIMQKCCASAMTPTPIGSSSS
jgi:hypothetical protein